MSGHSIRSAGNGICTLALLFLLVLFAGCGGAADEAPPPEAGAEAAAPQASASAFDPCTLLTAAEVEAALGWQPVTTTPYPQGNGTGHCKYEGGEGMTAEGVLRQLDAGIGVCPTNMPCTELPDFASSAELVTYRRQGYEGKETYGLDPVIEPVEGLGVPAISHEVAGLLTLELAIGGKRLAYVETWAPLATARALAEIVLARSR
jgi:hypothetical protein